MNKKTYHAPTMTVMEMETTSIIASSARLEETDKGLRGNMSDPVDDDGDAWNEGI